MSFDPREVPFELLQFLSDLQLQAEGLDPVYRVSNLTSQQVNKPTIQPPPLPPGPG
jgi:hypothetical protein